MPDKPLFMVMVIAVLAVAVILFAGIATFGRGGEFNRRHGNQLMRWRIIGQAIAIAMILVYVVIARH